MGLALVLLAGSSSWVVIHLPSEPGGLTAAVQASMRHSGVAHPVTAVLLNFRSYDTWLELGVLFLAMLGVLCLRRQTGLAWIHPLPGSNLVLAWLVRWLTPVLLLTAGTLLWMGKFAAGGAFQAGVVLAAAGVLLWLAGYRSAAAVPNWLWRVSLLIGIVAFFVAGVALWLAGNRLLEYPPLWAGTLIVVIEVGATISIAVALASLFIGLQPLPSQPPPPARTG